MVEDLLFQQEIKRAVRHAYRAIPTGAGESVARALYAADELAVIPRGAIDWALGVGNLVRDAALRTGDVVLDVGSGGGIDSILAAHRIGPTGRAIGLDLLPEMCERARNNARAAGVDKWADFVEGEMEDIPLPDSSVDVVISNGVLNLSPRKSRALAEVFRVLRPGGRLCFADLTVNEDLPPTVLGSDAAWAGCIAGALSEQVLINKLHRVGFDAIRISDRVPFSIDQAGLYPLFTSQIIELLRELLPPERHQRIGTSMLATAAKPTQ